MCILTTYLGGASRPWPPFCSKNVFLTYKKLGKLGMAPPCESTNWSYPSVCTELHRLPPPSKSQNYTDYPPRSHRTTPTTPLEKFMAPPFWNPKYAPVYNMYYNFYCYVCVIVYLYNIGLHPWCAVFCITWRFPIEQFSVRVINVWNNNNDTNNNIFIHVLF